MDMRDSVLFSIAHENRYSQGQDSRNPQNWYPELMLLLKEIENVNKFNLNLVVIHTINFQNFTEKNLRRTELVIEFKCILEDLEIDYTLLPQDVRLTPCIY
ncbi:hypothetical protein Bca52824_031911 [Brassica carinata]|uniref:Uncharacterized protein n=1 Tax=Brassica carinata TaxID=52824 RepID=A0A8X7SAY0_BRACI|nr:hypothetical protein Bca52824_031911 [Brassica carinata]